MDRATFLTYIGAAPMALWLTACGRSESRPRPASPAPSDSLQVYHRLPDFEPLDKPKSAWKGVVSEDAFHILFEEGTEPRYSSPLNEEERDGTFICAACYLPQFSSSTKYDSGTGWPSFWAPIAERYLGTKRDTKLATPRTEYHCARCGGHQGHVFEDGPDPTGLRYCNNGLALHFVPSGESLPPLRS